MTKLSIFALALAILTPPAHALALLDVRGAQLCAAAECFDRIPLGPTGLDLFAQMSQYESHFNANFEPKQTNEPITFARLLGVAGALGLSDEARVRVLREFSHLNVTELAARLHDAKPAADQNDVSIPFLAKIEWADHHAHRDVTSLSGRLVIPRGRDLDVGQPARDLNQQLSTMIQIDETSSAAPTKAQLIELVAPAVLGNLVLAYLSPAEHLKGTALENVGRFFAGRSPTR